MSYLVGKSNKTSINCVPFLQISVINCDTIHKRMWHHFSKPSALSHCLVNPQCQNPKHWPPPYLTNSSSCVNLVKSRCHWTKGSIFTPHCVLGALVALVFNRAFYTLLSPTLFVMLILIWPFFVASTHNRLHNFAIHLKAHGWFYLWGMS